MHETEGPKKEKLSTFTTASSRWVHTSAQFCHFIISPFFQWVTVFLASSEWKSLIFQLHSIIRYVISPPPSCPCSEPPASTQRRRDIQCHMIDCWAFPMIGGVGSEGLTDELLMISRDCPFLSRSLVLQHDDQSLGQVLFFIENEAVRKAIKRERG